MLLSAIGCATLLQGLLRPRAGPPESKPVFRALAVVVAAGLLLTVPAVASGVSLSWEHPLFENA